FGKDVLVEGVLEVAPVDADLQRTVLSAQDGRHCQHRRTCQAGAKYRAAGRLHVEDLTHVFLLCLPAGSVPAQPVPTLVFSLRQGLPVTEALNTIRLRLSNSICPPAWPMSLVGSSCGATATTSPPTRISPFRPRTRSRASRLARPPGSPVPVPGANPGS